MGLLFGTFSQQGITITKHEQIGSGHPPKKKKTQ